MLPFIKIGPLTIGTFGLLMWVAFLVAYFVLRADFRRRRLNIPADNVVLFTAFAGIAGAKLYHVLERPRDLLANPIGEIFSTYGFAWFGGLIAGIVTLFLLARHYKIPWLTFFDAVAPAAAIGYAVGRIGCLISGDGDYGVPTLLPWGMSFPHGLVPTTEVCPQYGFPGNCGVHPTPIYEFLIGLGIFYYLWWLGKRQLRVPRPAGEVLGEYLLWTGLARFLVEFIRINPRSFFGVLSNAQAASLASMLAGGALLIFIKRRFKSMKQEHKVMRHLESQGNPGVQPEYHRPTPECPNPERWHMFDSMSAEVEVLEFLKCLVTTIKPQLVVETGTFLGVSTLWIAEGLKQNGFGKVITCENDLEIYRKAKERFAASGLAQWIDCRNESSLETKIKGTIDLLFSDSAFEVREQEVRHFLPQLNPYGAIVMHDASSHLKTVREAALKLEAEGLISLVLMPTPRGLVLAQKRQGRK